MHALPVVLFLFAVIALGILAWRQWSANQRVENEPSQSVLEQKASRKRTAALDSNVVKLWMQVGISVVVLGGALYIIFSPAYDSEDKHWAYGSVGTILGFWLKQ
jgi:nicotinamide riboside transporter PnuC